MQTQEFYFTRLDANGDPILNWGVWCENLGASELYEGRVRGLVINGGWIGHFDATSLIIEGEDTDTSVPNVHEGRIVWFGKVPSRHRAHYNDAIKWICQNLVVKSN